MSADGWKHRVVMAMEWHQISLGRNAHVDVWSLSTDDLHDDAIGGLVQTLDRNERERIERKGSDESRRNSALAHGLLRYALAELANVTPDNIRLLRVSPQSKPVLAGPIGRTIDVSLSHCRGRVACAIGWNCDVGIDVEAHSRNVTPEWMRFALAPEEQRWIDQNRNDRRSGGLLHVWTLKEAVVKADGCGLTRDLDSFAVLPDPPRMTRCPPEMGAAALWHLWQCDAGQDHVLAVACRPFLPAAPRQPQVDGAHRSKEIGERSKAK